MTRSLLYKLRLRTCEVEVMRDMAGSHVDAEANGGFAVPAGWKFFAAYEHDIMLRSV
jgi:hypothetical protein